MEGYITVEDLRDLAVDFKEDKLTDKDLEEMIRLCDPDGKGVITWKAFLKFNKKNKF
jgi:Ca2+-binding EF-hand superfamily protein